MATRYSWFLTSRGMPTFMLLHFLPDSLGHGAVAAVRRGPQGPRGHCIRGRHGPVGSRANSPGLASLPLPAAVSVAPHVCFGAVFATMGP